MFIAVAHVRKTLPEDSCRSRRPHNSSNHCVNCMGELGGAEGHDQILVERLARGTG